MNEENEGERRMNGRQLVNQEVLRISKEEDRADMKMMKIGNMFKRSEGTPLCLCECRENIYQERNCSTV